MNELLQESVKNLFDYHEDGKLFWKITKNQFAKNGNRAGRLRVKYRRIGINNKYYYEHHIVWLYHNGYLPKQLDHINGVCNDNRIENLREATTSQNHMNMKKIKGTTSKYKGVHWDKRLRKWVGQIKKNGESIYLGLFDSEIDAGEAYNKKAVELFGEFAKLNEIEVVDE